MVYYNADIRRMRVKNLMKVLSCFYAFNEKGEARILSITEARKIGKTTWQNLINVLDNLIKAGLVEELIINDSKRDLKKRALRITDFGKNLFNSLREIDSRLEVDNEETKQ